MKITILGHASVLVENGPDRILVDPVLRTTPLASGGFGHTIPRELTLEAMPAPTRLAITHAHVDHLDPESLARLPRDLEVVVPDDPHTLEELRALGFERLHVLGAWETHDTGATRMTATPTDSGVDEVGYLFEGENGRYWHMSDAEALPEVGRKILAERGAMDVVATKYQPTTRVMARYFRGQGPAFDKREVIDWLEAACETRPKLVFPYAAGLSFFGRYAWLNRYLFPYSSEHIADLLRERLGSREAARVMLPGDVITLAGSAPVVSPQGSPFVRRAPGGGETEWEPIDTSHFLPLASRRDEDELVERLEAILYGPWVRWLAKNLRPGGAAARLLDWGVTYELVVHLDAERRLHYGVDLARRPIELSRARFPRASFRVHMSGSSLLEVLAGRAGSELLYACGDALMYERILGVRDGRFWAPPREGFAIYEELTDPLTYYLRWAAPKEGVLARGSM